MRKLYSPRKFADVAQGSLVLVNSTHPYCFESDPSLDVVDLRHPDVFAERKVTKLLRKVLDAVDTRGAIFPVSGYRTVEEQQNIWDKSVQEGGLSFTQKYVAIPGCSEHHTGLAADFGFKPDDAPVDFIRPSFPYDGVCGNFRKTALRFGFIERYPKGKEKITGIAHEPWHFRYVGFPHSVIMQTHGFCLEEHISYLQRFTESAPLAYYTGQYKIEIFCSESCDFDIRSDTHCEISGNNVGGYIATCWSRHHD